MEKKLLNAVGGFQTMMLLMASKQQNRYRGFSAYSVLQFFNREWICFSTIIGFSLFKLKWNWVVKNYFEKASASQCYSFVWDTGTWPPARALFAIWLGSTFGSSRLCLLLWWALVTHCSFYLT